MKEMAFPYCGFSTEWTFYDESMFAQQQPSNRKILNQVFKDIKNLLNLLFKYQLLFPTHLQFGSPAQRLNLKSSRAENILAEIKKWIQIGVLTDAEYVGIEGYGYVDLPDGTQGKQEHLIYVHIYSFRQRNFIIGTSKSLWVPLSIDASYQFAWQGGIADLNAERLQKCLETVHRQLNINVEPDATELDRDQSIWQKGFQLYLNPEILERYALKRNVDISKYLYAEER
jgi:hypothetical protein